APVLTGPAAGCVVLIAHREARQSRTLEVLERYQEELEASMQAVRQALGQARDRIQDLHERAEAEEASPAYAFPLDAVPYPMAILDGDGRLTSANDAFAEVMAAAYRTTVQPGTRLTDQMHPSDELMWAEMQSRVLEGQAVSREIQRATNDRVRTFDLHMTPIRHEGHLQGATCTLHEITETVERAAAPAQDTLLYATLARHIPGGTVMVFDRDLRFTHVDGDDVQVREVLKEMLEGERMPEILPPELAQRLEPLFHQALSGHDVQDHMDVMGQDMDLRVLPLRSQAGRVEAAMMISIERTPSEAAPPVSSQAPALTITPGADLFPRPPQVNAPTRPHQEARSWPPASAQAHGDAASVHPLFSLFFDALPQPTLVVDEHDRVVELNEAAHRVAGLDRHAVRRHAVREVFGDGLADRIQDARLVLAEGDAQATYCTHVEERGGLQEIQHQVEIAPVAGLERPHLLIQWREVETSRYSALAAEAYRTLLRTVVSHVPQVVFWKNRDGVYQGCNALFARLMGAQTPSDVIGRTDRDFFWGDEARLDLEAREHAVLAGEEDQVRTLEEYRTDNGRLLRIRATRVPLRNRDGHAVGLLGVYEAAR
ncbi:MAG: PAS domain-containing protein, partial [Bacteroidota bacterium]